MSEHCSAILVRLALGDRRSLVVHRPPSLGRVARSLDDHLFAGQEDVARVGRKRMGDRARLGGSVNWGSRGNKDEQGRCYRPDSSHHAVCATLPSAARGVKPPVRWRGEHSSIAGFPRLGITQGRIHYAAFRLPGEAERAQLRHMNSERIGALWSVRAVLAAALLGLSMQAIPSQAQSRQGTLVGKPAPSFRLQGIYGETYSLDQFKGHILVMQFGSSW